MLKRFLGPITVLLALAACTQTGAPAITVTVTPAPGATGVPINTLVTAVFSEDMDETTVDGSFTLSSAGGAVAGVVSYNAAARRATFTPNASLQYATKYTAAVAGTVRSKAGGELSNVTGGSYSWDFTTEVEPGPQPAVTDVEVSPATASILVGATVQLTADVTAVGGASEAVTWESSNTAVATVDDDGLVTAVAVGTATITATSDFDDSVSGAATVTVSLAPAVNGVTVSPATADLAVAGTAQLTATVDAVGGASEAVTWESSDTSVATVDDDGLVTAVAVGTATITATSDFNHSASGSATVTVHGPLSVNHYLPVNLEAETGTLDLDLGAAGGLAPYSYEFSIEPPEGWPEDYEDVPYDDLATVGTLRLPPDGIFVDEDEGALRGAAGSESIGYYAFFVVVTDSLGQADYAFFELTVLDGGPQ